MSDDPTSSEASDEAHSDSAPPSCSELALAWLAAVARADLTGMRRLSAEDIELSWPGMLSRGVFVTPPWVRVAEGGVVLGRVVQHAGVLIAECAHNASKPANQRVPPTVVVAIQEGGGRVVAASWHLDFAEAVSWGKRRLGHAALRDSAPPASTDGR
jgi:hypothetical protein